MTLIDKLITCVLDLCSRELPMNYSLSPFVSGLISSGTENLAEHFPSYFQDCCQYLVRHKSIHLRNFGALSIADQFVFFFGKLQVKFRT